MLHEIKSFNLDLKSLTDEGEFEGIASVYGNRDMDGEIMERGAFTKTAKERPTIPILYQHRRDEPIGVGHIEDLPEGLAVKGRLVLDVQRAREARALAQAGAIRDLSVGYVIPAGKKSFDAAREAWRIFEVKLYEISLVTLGANPLAKLHGVKSGTLNKFNEALTEIKAGKRISAATKSQIETAIKELQALLSEADADDEAADKGIEPELLHSMISDWRNAR